MTRGDGAADWDYPSCDNRCGRIAHYLDRDERVYCFACWGKKGGILNKDEKDEKHR